MERILEYRCHLQGPRRPSEAVMFSCENMVTERVNVWVFCYVALRANHNSKLVGLLLLTKQEIPKILL